MNDKAVHHAMLPAYSVGTGSPFAVAGNVPAHAIQATSHPSKPAEMSSHFQFLARSPMIR